MAQRQFVSYMGPEIAGDTLCLGLVNFLLSRVIRCLGYTVPEPLGVFRKTF